MAKFCPKCGVEKPDSEFHRRAANPDGLQAKCKACTAAYHRAYRRTPRGKAIRAKHRAIEYAKETPTQRTAKARRMRHAHPNRDRARNAVKEALRDQRMVRQPCEICGDMPTHAHHDDYRARLVVRWLCRPHHVAWHKLFKAEE